MVDFLIALPQEIAYQVVEEISPKDYLKFCRVSQRWRALLQSNAMANSVIRREFSKRSDLQDYVHIEDRFSVLRNLTFRMHAHLHGLAVKTKVYDYPGEFGAAVGVFSGQLALYLQKEDIVTCGVYVWDISRKATSPPRKIICLDGKAGTDPVLKGPEYHVGHGLLLKLDDKTAGEARVWDYSGNLIHKWIIQTSIAGEVEKKYLYGGSEKHVVIRIQDIDGQTVHYEIFDANSKSVMACDIVEDILSKQTKAALVSGHGAEYFDWEIQNCEIQIQDSAKTFSLSNRSTKGFFDIQRFSFASGSSLQEVSQMKVDFEVPRPSGDDDEVETWSLAGRGRGIMAASTNREDDEYLDVAYVWYDYNQPYDSEQNVHKEIWMVQSYCNPFAEAGCGTFFVMGGSLYGILPSDEDDSDGPDESVGFTYLPLGELEFENREAVQLGIPSHDITDLISDDRYAVVGHMDGVVVLEWHDYDSWRESIEGDWESKVETPVLIWSDESSDHGSSITHFKYI